MREILIGRGPESRLFYGCVAVAAAALVPIFNPVGYLLGAFYIVRGLITVARDRRSKNSVSLHAGDRDQV